MIFDPTQWHSVETGGEVHVAPAGRLRLRCSHDCSLYVIPEPSGTAVLVGSGRKFDIRLGGSSPTFFYLDGPKEAEAALWWPSSKAVPARLGSFTNPDRPFSGASSHMDAILGEVRRFQIETRNRMRQMQQDSRLREARAVTRALAEQKAESVAAAAKPVAAAAPEAPAAVPATPAAAEPAPAA